MSDYENAMSAGPGAALKRTVNAFRAGRAEAGASHGPSGPALRQALDVPPSPELGKGAPDWDAVRARIAAMGPDEKALAARQAEILTVAGQGLAGRSYAERKAILAHMAPHLAALGVGSDAGAGAAGGFDPSDRNLAQAVGEAVILRGMLGDAPTPGAAATAPTVPAAAPAAPTALSPGAPPPPAPAAAAG